MSYDPYDKITDHYVSILRWIVDDLRQSTVHTESPIETIFSVAFDTGMSLMPYTKLEFGKSKEWIVRDWHLIKDCQSEILGYRVDFSLAVISPKGDKQILVIECDGHDFHERTKEQAAHDRSKDRALTLAGYTVLRFTGSELYRNPGACAAQAFEWAIKIVDGGEK